MTQDQQRAHERLLSVLPKRTHIKCEVDLNQGYRLSAEKKRTMDELFETDLSNDQIAEIVGVSKSTVSRYRRSLA